WLALACVIVGLASCNKPQATTAASESLAGSNRSGSPLAEMSSGSSRAAADGPHRSAESSELSLEPAAEPRASANATASASAAANAPSVARSAGTLASTVAPSPRTMGELLRRTAAAVNVVNVPYIVNDRRVEMARDLLARSKTPGEHCQFGWVL